MDNTHHKFMKEALLEAKKAEAIGEVPIGAVIVNKNEIIARGYNLKEKLKDPTAHAEIIAIREASQKLGAWRLSDCTLYVTLEPCQMCTGAIIQARIGHVVFGARDPKAGCIVSLFNLLDDQRFNHNAKYTEGINEEECSLILKNFFLKLRNRYKEPKNI